MELLFLREEAEPKIEGRTLVARICTYDKVYEVSGKRERIKRGAFKSPIARPSGLLRYRHVGERPGDTDDPSMVYGPVRVLRDEDNGLIAEAEVIEGERGDHLLGLVRSGAIHGVSLSALISESKISRENVRDVTRIGAFYGFSVTPQPAYADAGVVALREKRRDEQAIRRALAENAEIRGRFR